MLRVNMECGIVVKDIPNNLKGGDNFKPIFLPKGGGNNAKKCTGI